MNLFGHLFKSPDSISNTANEDIAIGCKLASVLYLRILACGITISVLNDTARNRINGSENELSSEVLPILMETAKEILEQDQRKLVRLYYKSLHTGLWGILLYVNLGSRPLFFLN